MPGVCLGLSRSRKKEEKGVDVDKRPKTRGVMPPVQEASASTASIELFWIPLGAGGSGLVRWNGRIYETIRARLDGRRPLDLYHTALRVRLLEGHFVIETMWPSPDADTASRGVVVEGPVGGRPLARLRLFRYEVRRWRDGILPDAAEAVGGPQLLSDDSHRLVGFSIRWRLCPLSSGVGTISASGTCGIRTR